LLELLDVAEQRQRAPRAVRTADAVDAANHYFCAVGHLPNLEAEEDGGMEPGRMMGRRRKDARSIPAVNNLERADVKTAARTSRPSDVIRSKSAAQNLAFWEDVGRRRGD
jgi:hypothetical protein